MRKIIPISEPYIFGNEKKYINLCLKKNWISSYGKINNIFEKKIKQITNSKYVLLCNSGSSALLIAIRLLCKKDNEVIVQSSTFAATVNAIIYNNCNPIFMDIAEDLNIDHEKTIEFLNKKTFFKNGETYNKKTKRKIAAIIIVNSWGSIPNIKKLIKICKNKNIKIIEDSAAALGSFYKYKKITKHAGTISDIGCISLNGNKIITAGNGGILLFKNKQHYKYAKYLINQAKNNRDFEHNDIGYNFRISSINVAFAFGQIINLKKIIRKKKEIHFLYSKKLSNIKNIKLMQSKNYDNSWVNLLKCKLKMKSNIFKIFKKNNIEMRSTWYPLHIQKPYKKYETYKINNSLKLYKTSICLPSSYSLTKLDMQKVIDSLKKISS